MADIRYSIDPKNLTEQHVRHLPLHEVTQNFGTLGLYLRYKSSLEEHGLADNPELAWATQFALTLHANDIRTNGHYADHILRVPLRILEHYHIYDPEMIVGAVLHDGIEDHAKDIVAILAKEEIDDEQLARDKAAELLIPHIGSSAVRLIGSVTNPLLLPGQNKLEAYKEHTLWLVNNEPKGRVIKLSDFTDNAVGNHYTIGPKQQDLDIRYLDHYQIHRSGLFMPDSLITGTERLYALNQLTEGQARALARLAMSE